MSDTPSDAHPGSKPPGPDWRRLHLWQIQPVRDAVVVLGVVGLFWLGHVLSVVTVPLLVAILLAYLLEPVIAWLMRGARMTRGAAAAGLVVAVLVLVIVPSILGAIFGLVQLVGFVGRAASNTTAVYESVLAADDAERAARVESAGPAWVWARDQLATLGPGDDLNRVVGQVAERLSANAGSILGTTAGAGADLVRSTVSLLGGAFGLLFAAFLTAFFFYFVATGWVELQAFTSRLLPDKHRDRIVDLARKFDAVTSGFVRGRLTIAFIQAFVYSIGYFIAGVPASFILGPAVAVLSIVPYLSMVGVPVSIALLWIEGHEGLRGAWWWVVGAPMAVYAIGQIVDDYLLTPMIQGKSTNMDTPTILFATLAGGVLFGVFGVLIAIPLAACLKILIREVFWPRFKAWAEGREVDFLPIGDPQGRD